MNNLDKKNIWVLEDNAGCIFVYQEVLGEYYEVHILPDIASLFVKRKQKGKGPDLFISDIILPDGKFIDHLAKYREFHPTTPIIYVSGLDDYQTIRNSFTVGVQDYLTKPFRPTELLAKVEKTLRANEQTAPVPSLKGLGIEGKNVVMDGMAMDNLTTKQIQILSLFLQSKERQVDKETLIRSVWGNTNVHPKALDVHFYHLRRKLEEYGLQIKSIGNGQWKLLSRYVSPQNNLPPN